MEKVGKRQRMTREGAETFREELSRIQIPNDYIS